MYKAVIVGCGAISSKHVEAIKDAGVSLVAACDTNEQNLSAFCEKYGCKGYYDFETMLISEKPDALHICTPHFLHFEQIISALEKKIAVFTEKPPVMTSKQYETLEKYSDENITVCFQNRFNATTLAVKEMIEKEQYGPLLGANASVCWQRKGDYYLKSDWRGRKDKEGGSVLINQSIHTLDLLCFLLGHPTDVKATLINADHPYTDTEDTVFAAIDFKDKRATFLATNCAPSTTPAEITLVFEKARVRFDSKSLTISDKSNKVTDSQIPLTGKECWGDSHKIIIDKFYKMLMGDSNPCSVLNCKDTMELMFDIYKEEIK